MHVRFGDEATNMRTTVELTEAQRAELLKIAANRGMKGFSLLVQEALDEFLLRQASRRELVDAALAVKGGLLPKEADALQDRVRAVRADWR